MSHFLQHLAVNQEAGIDEHIEGVIHNAFGRVLDRYHAKIGASALHLAEHILDAVDGNILSGGPEFLHAGHVCERSPGPEIGDLLRPLQR